MNEIHLSINTSDPTISLSNLESVIPYAAIMYDTTSNWNTKRDLIATKGTLYVYSDHETSGEEEIPGIKIGDGTSYLIDMPFVDEALQNMLLDHLGNTRIHVSENDRKKWGTTQYEVDGTTLKFL